MCAAWGGWRAAFFRGGGLGGTKAGYVARARAAGPGAGLGAGLVQSRRGASARRVNGSIKRMKQGCARQGERVVKVVEEHRLRSGVLDKLFDSLEALRREGWGLSPATSRGRCAAATRAPQLRGVAQVMLNAAGEAPRYPRPGVTAGLLNTQGRAHAPPRSRERGIGSAGLKRCGKVKKSSRAAHPVAPTAYPGKGRAESANAARPPRRPRRDVARLGCSSQDQAAVHLPERRLQAVQTVV